MEQQTEPPVGSMEQIERSLASLLEYQVLGSTLWNWTIALTVALVLMLVLMTARRIAVRRLGQPDKRRRHVERMIVRVIRSTQALFILTLSVYFGSLLLEGLAPRAGSMVWGAFIVMFAVQAAIWGGQVIHEAIDWFLDLRRTDRDEQDAALVTTMSAVRLMSMVLLYTVIILMAVDNLGWDVTALITGLGVGGIAVALAVQNVLGDLFASLSIVLDKPFMVKDFIIVGDQLGTVERIGLKTTRVKSLSGEQLVFSNSDLLNSRIRNFKRMAERRVVFSIRVTYQTPLEKLERIPAIIREAVESQELTRFDRAHFQQYGASSLDFETVYFVLSADFNVYMDIQQAINFHLLRRFEELGVKFAYPTQTLYVNQAQAGGTGAEAPAQGWGA